ncbi:MAG TPA: hypothetical protein VJ742_13215 [Nitrososphaera sp.]|nr:hypothetical protein [Nitrososphaera sp.]
MDETLAADITAESLAQANDLLEFLVKKADKLDKPWLDTLKGVLTDKELQVSHKAISERVEELGIDAPYGVVVGGTGLAKDEAGLAGEDGQRAIRLLKASNRLLQSGRGRGKALVILLETPISEKDFKSSASLASNLAKVTSEEIDDLDTLAKIKLVQSDVRSMQSELAALRKELERVSKDRSELEKIVEARNLVIEDLEKKIAQQAATSWQ